VGEVKRPWVAVVPGGVENVVATEFPFERSANSKSARRRPAASSITTRPADRRFYFSAIGSAAEMGMVKRVVRSLQSPCKFGKKLGHFTSTEDVFGVIHG